MYYALMPVDHLNNKTVQSLEEYFENLPGQMVYKSVYDEMSRRFYMFIMISTLDKHNNDIYNKNRNNSYS